MNQKEKGTMYRKDHDELVASIKSRIAICDVCTQPLGYIVNSIFSNSLTDDDACTHIPQEKYDKPSLAVTTHPVCEAIAKLASGTRADEKRNEAFRIGVDESFAHLREEMNARFESVNQEIGRCMSTTQRQEKELDNLLDLQRLALNRMKLLVGVGHDAVRDAAEGEMYTRRAMVLKDIIAERDRQERLRDEGKFHWTCASADESNSDKLAILAEEFGETAKEVTELIINKNAAARVTNQLKRNLYKELVQTAAVAVAWAEALREEEVQLMPVAPVARHSSPPTEQEILAETIRRYGNTLSENCAKVREEWLSGEDPIAKAARELGAPPARNPNPEKFIQCTMRNAQGIQCILNHKHGLMNMHAGAHDYGTRESFRAPERAVENPTHSCIKCGHQRDQHIGSQGECRAERHTARHASGEYCVCTKFEGKRDALNPTDKGAQVLAQRDALNSRVERPSNRSHVENCDCSPTETDSRCNP